VYIERDGVRVAFVSADATLSDFQASENGAGTCHVSRKDVDAAMTVLGPSIEEARAQADVVFVAMHWGRNKKSRPSQSTRRLGAAIIEAGADAILGTSAHQLQGVEVVDGRPILYDAGNLLFDSHADGEMARSGVFRLDFDQSGVHRIELRPIDLDYGYSLPAQGNSGARSLIRFRDLSAELGTLVELKDGVARIGLPVPASRPKIQRDDDSESSRTTTTEVVRPAAQPPPGCVVDEVPEEAKIDPVSWGPIKLLGIRMRPSEPTERRTVWLESWWSTERQIVDDLWIYQRVKSVPFHLESMWWADHEHCDWAWPTSRWRPGEIIKDVYGLRPPKTARPGPYELVMGLIRHEERLGDGVRMFQFQYQ
jgi:hypothetical protein